MNTSVQLFFIFLLSGLFMIGTEIFVPGGIIGTIGAIALLLAIAMGFAAFGPVTGGYIAAGIVVMSGVSIFLWMKFLPKTRLGKMLTVKEDLARSRAVPDKSATLLDREGEALSELRPAGFAMIEGKRVDVVTQGEMIAKGQRIKVVEVKGIRVVVKRVQ